jgi:hypothetical protein
MPLFPSLAFDRNSNCRGGPFGDSDADIYAGKSVAFMTVRVSEGNRVAKGLGNKGETHLNPDLAGAFSSKLCANTSFPE